MLVHYSPLTRPLQYKADRVEVGNGEKGTPGKGAEGARVRIYRGVIVLGGIVR